MRGWALWALLAIIGALSLCGYGALWALAAPALTASVAGSYNTVFAGLFALYLLACYVVLRYNAALPQRSTLILVAAVAVLGRATLVFALPTLSDDMYRYIWDGRVQAAGLSPYQYPPGAPELASLRPPQSELWQRINRKSAITIYPPGAELFYAALYNIAPDNVAATKAGIVLVDLASCVTLFFLLRRLGMTPLRTLVYAWAPLPIIEFGSSGHVEALSVLLTLLALLAGVIAAQRSGAGKLLSGWAGALAAGALVGAALVKLIPLLLLAGWRQRLGWKLLAGVVALFALVYAVYVWAHGGFISPFLATYLGAEENNSLLYVVLGRVIAPAIHVSDALVRQGLAAALALTALGLTLKRERGPYDFIGKSFLLVFAYLLLATSSYPWYATWLLLFVPLFMPPAGLPIFGPARSEGQDRLPGSYGPALAALLYCGLTFVSGYTIFAIRVPDIPLSMAQSEIGLLITLGALWPLGSALLQQRRLRRAVTSALVPDPTLAKQGVIDEP